MKNKSRSKKYFSQKNDKQEADNAPRNKKDVKSTGNQKIEINEAQSEGSASAFEGTESVRE